jgi:hypothetical protein
MRDPKEKIEATAAQLIALTSKFCDERINDEYKQLCVRLIEKMARKRNVPFLSGRIEIWAAAVVHALGSINFLFDKNSTPYVAGADICAYFGANTSTVGQKAKVIRDMFRMNYFDPEFSTKHVRENNPLKNYVMKDGFIVPRENAEAASVAGERAATVQMPADFETWVTEIAHGWIEALETKPYGKSSGQELTDLDLCLLAPYIAVRNRGLEDDKEMTRRAKEAALSSYAANKDHPDGALKVPEMAFAFCYLAGHFGLGLVDAQKVDEYFRKLEGCREEFLEYVRQLKNDGTTP